MLRKRRVSSGDVVCFIDGTNITIPYPHEEQLTQEQKRLLEEYNFEITICSLLSDPLVYDASHI